MNNKIKIAMITANMDRTGISTVIMNYCRNIDLEKYEVDLLVGYQILNEYRNECEKLGVTIVELPSKSENPRAFYKMLKVKLHEKKYDIAHVHGNSAMIVPELFMAWCNGIDVRIAHSHNTTCSHLLMNKILRPIFNILYTDAVACSVPAGKWMFGKRKYRIISNGINCQSFSFSKNKRAEFRKEIGVDKQIVIGHVGQFNDQKNHIFLINVFAEIFKYDNSVKLLLIGNGPLYDEIKNIVSKSSYKDNVIFYGETNSVQKAYAAMDIFVLPSLHEGLPLVLVEAQASGLSCIVSDQVSKEANITENMEFLSLEDESSWKNKIVYFIKKCKEIDREQQSLLSCQKIAQKGYDIVTSTEVLQDLYLDCLNKVRGNN